jgi:hypothetical protein
MQAASTLVIYDLRDSEQWRQAGYDCQVWGRKYAEIYTLGNDHVVIEIRAGMALEAAA